ncbi:hypothetical protein ACP4OV_026326 [Aristida adscensionis]
MKHSGISDVKFYTKPSDYKVYDEETGKWCKPDGYDMLISDVVFSLEELEGFECNGSVVVKGSEAAETRYAEDNSAKEAVLYLERKKNIELVDYNYTAKVAAADQLVFLKDLNKEYLFLGATVKGFWERMLVNLGKAVDQQMEQGRQSSLQVVVALGDGGCLVNSEQCWCTAGWLRDLGFLEIWLHTLLLSFLPLCSWLV